MLKISKRQCYGAEIDLLKVETLGMEIRTTKINDGNNFLQGATTLTVDDTTGFEDNGYIRIKMN